MAVALAATNTSLATSPVFIGVDGGSLPSLAAGFTLAFAGVQHLRISKEDNNSNPEAAAREVVTGREKAQLKRKELELVHIMLQLQEKETKAFADANRKKDAEAKPKVAQLSYFAAVLSAL
ncbi:hypothetical protein FIBSPDRAFT_881457 [Athelia psychrophila]|uniref:Uncharacterized protein n=1 Tax=Athelia psychrophila TaxID=1759441 RepID=A0A166WQ14_9AGAM|nr:hypothetical protein FIBSPDRAFT_881457 [Fibularhizoctonia sp. CBS 109695]